MCLWGRAGDRRVPWREGKALRQGRGFYNQSNMKRLLLALVLPLAAALALLLPAPAQFSNPEPVTTQVHNSAPLRPPAGARVAIIEWDDLECPDCARANPVLAEAAAKYHIPWVRHDFPLPFHHWSFQAAVDARWFDAESDPGSPKLGDAFRDAVFAAQPTIHSEDDLRRFAETFAKQHHLKFPAVVDPQGKLRELVKADFELGMSVGITHTPTIWVVTNQKNSKPFIEVVDRTRLFTLIQQALAETGDSRQHRARSAGHLLRRFCGRKLERRRVR